MEDTFAEIGARCADDLRGFMQCVEGNPDSWQTECKAQRAAVSKCAAQNTVLQKVKKTCSSQIAAYQTCLEKNPTQPDLCTDTMTALYECHRSVAGIYDPPKAKN